MNAVVVIAAVIVIAIAGGILFWYFRRKKYEAYSSIYYVNHYGRKSQSDRYHLLKTISDEDLEWLFRFYNNEIRTRTHKTAGGMLVERPSPFQLQIERDLKNRRLSDEQIDELTLKLYKGMERIRRYDPERTRKMDDIRQQLQRIKKYS